MDVFVWYIGMYFLQNELLKILSSIFTLIMIVVTIMHSDQILYNLKQVRNFYPIQLIN